MGAKIAVLVAVELTGQRRKLTSAARLALAAAAVRTDAGEEPKTVEALLHARPGSDLTSRHRWRSLHLPHSGNQFPRDAG
jgi:hypothetical protein